MRTHGRGQNTAEPDTPNSLRGHDATSLGREEKSGQGTPKVVRRSQVGKVVSEVFSKGCIEGQDWDVDVRCLLPTSEVLLLSNPWLPPHSPN